MRNILLFLVIGVITLALAEKFRYDNYQVHRLTPKNEAQLQALHELMLSGKFDFWLEPRKVGLPVDVLVPPTKKQFFQYFLRTNGIQHEIKIENAQKLIDEEQKRMATRSTKQVEWTDYHTLDEIYDWLDQLADQNENVNVVVGGKTYEGRDIRGIEINNGDGLPGVVIESGIHAREWITVAASSWVVNQIVNADSDSVWRQFNWLYFPSVNPDGYVFSWENDRYWRKTRTPYRLGIITCYGADANRNYGSHWGEGGSDLNNPCSETYAGPSAFSEVESKSLSDYLTQIATERNNQIYVAYHSYSQLLMFPWGYTGTPIPEHDLYQSIGDAAAESLRQVHGTRFEVGSIYDTIYQTSGTSTEWYYDKLNPVLSYVYEMRDTGNYGFVLPPDQIIPAGEEHLASLQTILEEFQKLGKK